MLMSLLYIKIIAALYIDIRENANGTAKLIAENHYLWYYRSKENIIFCDKIFMIVSLICLVTSLIFIKKIKSAVLIQILCMVGLISAGYFIKHKIVIP